MQSRREFLLTTAGAVSVLTLAGQESSPEPIIDIHQHTNYHDRDNSRLLAHQRAMGITQSILLPSGSAVRRWVSEV